MDESFLDVSSIVDDLDAPNFEGHVYGDIAKEEDMSIVHKLAAASRFCAEARQRLKEELGYTCCAGISTGKIGA